MEENDNNNAVVNPPVQPEQGHAQAMSQQLVAPALPEQMTRMPPMTAPISQMPILPPPTNQNWVPVTQKGNEDAEVQRMYDYLQEKHEHSRAEVFQHMTLAIKHKKVRYICKHCSQLLSVDQRGTSNYRKHMQKHHPDVFKSFADKKVAKRGPYHKRKQKLHLNQSPSGRICLVQLMSRWMLPFPEVSNRSFEFQSFLGSVRNGVVDAQDANTVAADISHVHGSFAAHVKNLLKSIDHVSLTTEVWHAEGFPGSFHQLRVHWADDNFELRSVVITVDQVPRIHNGEHLGGRWFAKCKEFELCDKVVALTADSSVYDLSAHKHFLNLLNRPDVIMLHSATHKANSLIQQAIRTDLGGDLSRTFSHVRAIAHKLEALNILKESVKATELGFEFMLRPCDVGDRWDTTYVMARVILKLSDALLHLYPNMRVKPLEDTEMMELKEFVDVVRPLEFLINPVWGNATLSIGLALPLINGAGQQLHKIQNSLLCTSTSKLCQEILKSVIQPWNQDFAPQFQCCVFLDPNFADIRTNDHSKLPEEGTRGKVLNEITALASAPPKPLPIPVTFNPQQVQQLQPPQIPNIQQLQQPPRPMFAQPQQQQQQQTGQQRMVANMIPAPHVPLPPSSLNIGANVAVGSVTNIPSLPSLPSGQVGQHDVNVNAEDEADVEEEEQVSTAEMKRSHSLEEPSVDQTNLSKTQQEDSNNNNNNTNNGEEPARKIRAIEQMNQLPRAPPLPHPHPQLPEGQLPQQQQGQQQFDHFGVYGTESETATTTAPVATALSPAEIAETQLRAFESAAVASLNLLNTHNIRIDVPKFFKTHKGNFRHVYDLARKFFCIQASSVPSRRLLNSDDSSICIRRTDVNTFTLRSQLLLHDNWDSFQGLGFDPKAVNFPSPPNNTEPPLGEYVGFCAAEPHDEWYI